MSASCDLQEAGLDEIGLGSVNPVGEHRLLAARQELASLVIGEAQLFRRVRLRSPRRSSPLERQTPTRASIKFGSLEWPLRSSSGCSSLNVHSSSCEEEPPRSWHSCWRAADCRRRTHRLRERGLCAVRHSDSTAQKRDPVAEIRMRRNLPDEPPVGRDQAGIVKLRRREVQAIVDRMIEFECHVRGRSQEICDGYAADGCSD